MADKTIKELPTATEITQWDLFLLEQSDVAKNLPASFFIAWLTAAADGHGGVSGIEKTGTVDLVDTYTITLADGTTYDFTVTNGEKGDKGDFGFVWIRYASQRPTEDNPSMGEEPDDWIGVYSGNLAEAPEDWSLYKWFKFKGETGETGTPAELKNSSVMYQTGTSATEIPTGEWSEAIPETAPGGYLWSRTVHEFNSGDPVTVYAVTRFGTDGAGTVNTINGIPADETGNVNLSAQSVGALPLTGGAMQGALNADGHQMTGLPAPSNDDDAVPYSLVKNLRAAAWTNAAAAASFAKQTLRLSDATNKGKTAVIQLAFYGGTADNNMYFSAELPVLTYENTYQMCFALLPEGATEPTVVMRNVTVQRQSAAYIKISITDAYVGSMEVTDNTLLIPAWIDFIREVT